MRRFVCRLLLRLRGKLLQLLQRVLWVRRELFFLLQRMFRLLQLFWRLRLWVQRLLREKLHWGLRHRMLRRGRRKLFRVQRQLFGPVRGVLRLRQRVRFRLFWLRGVLWQRHRRLQRLFQRLQKLYRLRQRLHGRVPGILHRVLWRLWRLRRRLLRLCQRMYDGMCIRLFPGLLRLLWRLRRKLFRLQRVLWLREQLCRGLLRMLWLRLRLFRGMRGRLRCNLRHHLQRHLLWELPGPVLWDSRGGCFRLNKF